jgi:hypothetical protein
LVLLVVIKSSAGEIQISRTTYHNTILYLLDNKPMAYRQLTCFITCVFLLVLNTEGQDSLYRIVSPVYIHCCLFYDFPQSFGVTAGVELPVSSRLFVSAKRGSQKEKYRTLVTTSDAGFYRYSFNNTGLFLLQSVGYRYHAIRPYYFEWFATVGILRTFYDGTVYAVSDNGAVNILHNFGRLYAFTGFTAVFGHDFERSAKPKPLSVSIRPSLWVQYPYNSFILPHLSFWLSLSYHFQHFSVSVRQRKIKRIPY